MFIIIYFFTFRPLASISADTPTPILVITGDPWPRFTSISPQTQAPARSFPGPAG